MKGKTNSAVWTILGILAVALGWEFAARSLGSELILPGPLPVARRFLTLLTDPRFPPAVGASLLRVIYGFLLALPAALLIGVPAGLDARARAFIRPLFSVISSTPVLSIILIALLWFGPDRVPVFTSFLMIFPVLTGNVMEGVRSTDPRLVEFAHAYRFSRKDLFAHLYLPSIMPYLLAGTRSSLALSWKVVVAAEVLSQPARALGTGMQAAKAQLETTELFAWTAAAVILAATTDVILSIIVKRRRAHGSLA
ncbi:MAG: ABC transporter permease subunit [Treponemataceae bacterium]